MCPWYSIVCCRLNVVGLHSIVAREISLGLRALLSEMTERNRFCELG